MIIGIDHGYYAIKTRHVSFPAGIIAYGEQEPYTRQNLLVFDGQHYVCGTGRQPIQRDKTETDNYYLLTLAALAQELRARGAPNECSVTIAAGLPLTSFGRDKTKFHDYLFRSPQPVCFEYEGTEYRITVEDVQLFPQGYTALFTEPDMLRDEPSFLLMDIGGWTVDLMRIDHGRPAAETCHSLEYGMIRCIDAVREEVRRQGRAYTERLLSAVLEAGFDCKAMPVVMLGGGASVVNRHVGPKDALCRATGLRSVGPQLSDSETGEQSNAGPSGASNRLSVFAQQTGRLAVCRAVALLDDRVNAAGFESACGQLSGRVGQA